MYLPPKISIVNLRQPLQHHIANLKQSILTPLTILNIIFRTSRIRFQLLKDYLYIRYRQALEQILEVG